MKKVRLVDESGEVKNDSNFGMLQMYFLGGWRHVCMQDMQLDMIVEIACEELSFDYGGTAFGSDMIQSWAFDNLQCSQSATSISECSKRSTQTCQSSQLMHITCGNPNTSF